MNALNQFEPFQYSRLFVWILNPKVPAFGFLGLSEVFQKSIVGIPTMSDKP